MAMYHREELTVPSVKYKCETGCPTVRVRPSSVGATTYHKELLIGGARHIKCLIDILWSPFPFAISATCITLSICGLSSSHLFSASHVDCRLFCCCSSNTVLLHWSSRLKDGGKPERCRDSSCAIMQGEWFQGGQCHWPSPEVAPHPVCCLWCPVLLVWPDVFIAFKPETCRQLQQ